jgi:hypothetical protein
MLHHFITPRYITYTHYLHQITISVWVALRPLMGLRAPQKYNHTRQIA